jgi:hypothetical protein
MHLSAYILLNLKDLPKGHLGLRGHSLSIGKEKPESFSAMAFTFIREIADYYLMFEDVNVLNMELDKLRNVLAKVGFKEIESEESE